jgi:hypothetical protein
MFMIHMPKSFKVGDTADCRINKIPQRLTWRDEDTIVIEPDDARTIVTRPRGRRSASLSSRGQVRLELARAPRYL